MTTTCSGEICIAPSLLRQANPASLPLAPQTHFKVCLLQAPFTSIRLPLSTSYCLRELPDLLHSGRHTCYLSSEVSHYFTSRFLCFAISSVHFLFHPHPPNVRLCVSSQVPLPSRRRTQLSGVLSRNSSKTRLKSLPLMTSRSRSRRECKNCISKRTQWREHLCLRHAPCMNPLQHL